MAGGLGANSRRRESVHGGRRNSPGSIGGNKSWKLTFGPESSLAALAGGLRGLVKAGVAAACRRVSAQWRRSSRCDRSVNLSTRGWEMSAPSRAESPLPCLPDQPLPTRWLISVPAHQVHPPANRIRIFARLHFFFTSSGKLPTSFLIQKYKSKTVNIQCYCGDNGLKEDFSEGIFSFSSSTRHTLFLKLRLLLILTVSPSSWS